MSAASNARRKRPKAPSHTNHLADPEADFEAERKAWAAQQKPTSKNGAPVTAEQVQEYAQKLEDDNEQTLDRTIAEAAAAEQVGAATLAKLDGQKKQLQKIDGDLKDMNVTMSRSDRIMSGMKSWTVAIWNSMSSPKKAPDTSFEGSGAAAKADAKRNAEDNAKAAAKAKSDAAANQKTSAAFAGAPALVVTKSGASSSSPPLAKRPVPGSGGSALVQNVTKNSRVDSQLDALSAIVTTLGEQAKDMNRVIGETSDLVDHIDGVVTTTTSKVNRSTRTAEEIIRDN